MTRDLPFPKPAGSFGRTGISGFGIFVEVRSKRDGETVKKIGDDWSGLLHPDQRVLITFIVRNYDTGSTLPKATQSSNFGRTGISGFGIFVEVRSKRDGETVKKIGDDESMERFFRNCQRKPSVWPTFSRPSFKQRNPGLVFCIRTRGFYLLRYEAREMEKP
jgi:ribosomal protein S16